MGNREKIIRELGFLDEASFVMDAIAKDGNQKASFNEEVPDVTENQGILSMIDGLSDEAALKVIEAYNKIPEEVKNAVKGFYNALQSLGTKKTIEDVKESLKALKGVCGEEYGDVYRDSVKDAKKLVPKIQTRLMMESLDDENESR